jgi:diguanylate cyclase (GGDEF)-like protein
MDTDGAMEMAEKIRYSVENAQINLGDNAVSVTVSVGVGLWQTEWTQDQCIEKTDKALYESKENGKNRVTLAQG